jgi:hypothetical protein
MYPTLDSPNRDYKCIYSFFKLEIKSFPFSINKIPSKIINQAFRRDMLFLISTRLETYI